MTYDAFSYMQRQRAGDMNAGRGDTRYKLLKHGCMPLMLVSCSVGSNNVILSTAEYGLRLGALSATRGGECDDSGWRVRVGGLSASGGTDIGIAPAKTRCHANTQALHHVP